MRFNQILVRLNSHDLLLPPHIHFPILQQHNRMLPATGDLLNPGIELHLLEALLGHLLVRRVELGGTIVEVGVAQFIVFVGTPDVERTGGVNDRHVRYAQS